VNKYSCVAETGVRSSVLFPRCFVASWGSLVASEASGPADPWRLSGDSGSYRSWPMHLVPRRWQVIQTVSAGETKMHLTFRRLHDQQLRVPLRTFRRLVGCSIGGVVLSVNGKQPGRDVRRMKLSQTQARAKSWGSRAKLLRRIFASGFPQCLRKRHLKSHNSQAYYAE
jgi:hypothetical protein